MTKETNMKFRYLTKVEEERAIILILEKLLDNSIPFSGAHRKRQWERGWRENLESGNGVPKYFGKYKIQRLNGRLVVGKSKNYEQDMLYTIVDALGKKYLSKMHSILEFGAGTGHNLWRMKAIAPNATLYGLDWTKSGVEMIRSQGFRGEVFDFFHPPILKRKDRSKYSTEGVGFYTVAALEQVGGGFKPFVNYCLRYKPGVIVHIEPIPELLDSTKLLDYLSIQYMFKRHYLRGYLTYLEELEKKGKIKILEARRSGIGSLMIDGYSVVVWRPI